MSTTEPTTELLRARPKRADARRNYDKVISAARAAFTETGAETSLEGIARRAGVGIGTLYRHFPNRQSLLEAVYVEEVERVSASVTELAGLEPWEALSTWLEGFVGYMVTKQALASELLDNVDPGAPLFMSCRASLYAAAGPLLARAQEAGAVRTDVELADVIHLVGGIAKMQNSGPEQVARVLSIALDGLRCQPS
jgi:AcrR family transcriptional regulator